MYILRNNTSVLLDKKNNFSFIISKIQCDISFKLKIVNLCEAHSIIKGEQQ